ncbi:MAG TPA: AAA family ATPase [Victivallales bacterium]|nr:AAA family ATPase [Victivallales bacterium]
MKIAITGKGGVGKSSIIAFLARALSETGNKVLLIDADPDMSLATILGLHNKNDITPITELKELIAERTGTKVNTPSPIFKMNPKVDDIPDKYCINFNNIKLITMGTIRKGGGGCACPENTFIKQLLSHLVIQRKEIVLLDMEAGIEHLGRGTAIGVDRMIVVVEPSLTSIDTAHRIKKLSKEIGIKSLVAIGNKIQNSEDRDFINENLKDINIAGFIEYADIMKKLNSNDIELFSIQGRLIEQIDQILKKIL